MTHFSGASITPSSDTNNHALIFLILRPHLIVDGSSSSRFIPLRGVEEAKAKSTPIELV
jgi:hypothetical protein